MAFYKDYFTINEEYTPNMTREAINRDSRTWLQFYPHESFVAFLRAVLGQMDGGKRSVWLTGPYGSGKSHAALVLQKLFMDDESRVIEWLDKRKEQVPPAIRKALLDRRKDGTLVVFDYNSDDVGPKEQFLVRIEQTIVRALQDGKLVVPPKGSLENLIARVCEEDSNFFKTRDQIQHELVYLNSGIRTIEQLVNGLNDQKIRDGLWTDTQKVLRARSIYLDLSASVLLQWVDAVLVQNNLKKLVYVWDEFSSFIDRNRSQLKTFEELAESAEQGKFYFIPVTHMNIEAYLAHGSDSAKKANDRFEFKAIEMPNDTAFQLAADAFQTIPEDQEEWENERMQLWYGIKDVAEIYFQKHAPDIRPESFKKILPLHPMAAFVLKHLSTIVGSNQRSLFDYLKGNASGAEFRTFMAKGGPTVPSWQYLTVDHLWRYFIERDDLGTSQETREIRAEFERQKSTGLQPHEERVLRAVLLFSLLGRLTPDGHELLQPTIENIEKCFQGDGDLVGVEQIVKQLSDQHCFTIIDGRIEMFRSTVGGAELELEKAKLRTKFHQLVLSEQTTAAVDQKIRSFNWGGRFEVRVANVDAITPSSIPNRDRFAKDGGNQVLVQFILARDANEQLQIPEKIKSLVKQFYEHRMVFLTMPRLTFCDTKADHWEEYIMQCAHLALASGNTSKRIHQQAIDAWDKEWIGRVTAQNQCMKGYKPIGNGESETMDLSWGNIKEWLWNFVKATLPDCVDEFAGGNLTAFGSPNSLKIWALAGMQFETANGTQKNFVRIFEQKGISSDEDWFDQNSQHSFSKMRDLCEKKIKNTVGANTTCSVRKIYIELQRAPYGLRCVPYSAFVLGFVLKGWLTKKPSLQWTNGQITKRLDADTLAEIIESVVKDDGANKIKDEKLICRLSKEEKAFVEQSSEMFGIIESNPDGTVEAALETVQRRIEQISGRVPLWVLPDYITAQADPQAEILGQIIQNFCSASIISSRGKIEERTNYIKEIGKVLLETDGLAKAFSVYIKRDVFNAAFQEWVEKTEPELLDLAESVGDHVKQYCQTVKDKFVKTAGWLWNAHDVENVIAEVLCEYRVVYELQPLLNCEGYVPFKDAIQQLKDVVFKENKIPKTMVVRKYPALEALFNCLTQPDGAAFADELSKILSNAHKAIQTVFFDPEKVTQLKLIQEKLGEEMPSAWDEAMGIYSVLPYGVSLDEDTFLQQARGKIQEYRTNSLVAQIRHIWNETTGTESPDDWSDMYRLPASMLFTERELSCDVLAIIANPTDFTPTTLKRALDTLQEMSTPDIANCRRRFVESVVPNRYRTLKVDASALCEWLSEHVDKRPNQWQRGQAMTKAVGTFIKQQYEFSFREIAVGKIKQLSGDDVKRRLLKLVDENPDIGLAFLEE